MNKLAPLAIVLSASLLAPGEARAATALDGSSMGWPWAIPFLGILLIDRNWPPSLSPYLAPSLRQNRPRMGNAGSVADHDRVQRGNGALGLCACTAGRLPEFHCSIVCPLHGRGRHSSSRETCRGTPLANTTLLATGAAMASIVGTTGAAMILIRPVITANASRRHNAHIIIFFIILVANVGGALTPLGDPPLFVGFLRGEDFFWTAQHLWLQTLLVSGLVLTIFVVVETVLFRREKVSVHPKEPAIHIRLRGTRNLLLIALIIAVIFASAVWESGISFDVFGTHLELQNLVRDTALVAIALLSLWLTPDEHRTANGFTWEPIREVAILFAGIFTAIVPNLSAMLGAGTEGSFASLFSAVTSTDGTPNEVAYFWLTGILSAFLDNVPTYLVFFELAGGDPNHLMGPAAGTLAPISMGAVYMGALTYIGNAPNFMVYAIAVERGIRMPSFFAYMLWAAAVLVPLFALLTFLPIPPIFRFS